MFSVLINQILYQMFAVRVPSPPVSRIPVNSMILDGHPNLRP